MPEDHETGQETLEPIFRSEAIDALKSRTYLPQLTVKSVNEFIRESLIVCLDSNYLPTKTKKLKFKEKHDIAVEAFVAFVAAPSVHQIKYAITDNKPETILAAIAAKQPTDDFTQEAINQDKAAIESLQEVIRVTESQTKAVQKLVRLIEGEYKPEESLVGDDGQIRSLLLQQRAISRLMFPPPGTTSQITEQEKSAFAQIPHFEGEELKYNPILDEALYDKRAELLAAKTKLIEQSFDITENGSPAFSKEQRAQLAQILLNEDSNDFSLQKKKNNILEKDPQAKDDDQSAYARFAECLDYVSYTDLDSPEIKAVLQKEVDAKKEQPLAEQPVQKTAQPVEPGFRSEAIDAIKERSFFSQTASKSLHSNAASLAEEIKERQIRFLNEDYLPKKKHRKLKFQEAHDIAIEAIVSRIAVPTKNQVIYTMTDNKPETILAAINAKKPTEDFTQENINEDRSKIETVQEVIRVRAAQTKAVQALVSLIEGEYQPDESSGATGKIKSLQEQKFAIARVIWIDSHPSKELITDAEKTAFAAIPKFEGEVLQHNPILQEAFNDKCAEVEAATQKLEVKPAPRTEEQHTSDSEVTQTPPPLSAAAGRRPSFVEQVSGNSSKPTSEASALLNKKHAAGHDLFAPKEIIEKKSEADLKTLISEQKTVINEIRAAAKKDKREFILAGPAVDDGTITTYKWYHPDNVKEDGKPKDDTQFINYKINNITKTMEVEHFGQIPGESLVLKDPSVDGLNGAQIMVISADKHIVKGDERSGLVAPQNEKVQQPAQESFVGRLSSPNSADKPAQQTQYHSR